MTLPAIAFPKNHEQLYHSSRKFSSPVIPTSLAYVLQEALKKSFPLHNDLQKIKVIGLHYNVSANLLTEVHTQTETVESSWAISAFEVRNNRI